MNYSEKINALLNALEKKTKDSKYSWKSISNYFTDEINESLRRYIVENSTYYTSFKFNYQLNSAKSFALKLKEGNVFLLTYDNKRNNNEEQYILALQNNNESSLITLNYFHMNQELIRSLYNEVNNRNDDIDNLVKFIIKDEE